MKCLSAVRISVTPSSTMMAIVERSVNDILGLSKNCFRNSLFLENRRQLAIGNGPNHAEEWIGKLLQNDSQVSQSSWTKNPIFHGVPKQFDKFSFINHQVNAIVLSVFVLAKPKCFPGTTVYREQIPLDSTLVVVAAWASTDRSTFNSVHFGHAVLHGVPGKPLESSRFY